MSLVVRPDLSARTALSKSQLNTADFCATAAWYDIHGRRPMIPSERVAFGRAVDAGVEQVVYAASRGADAGSLAYQAALEEASRSEVPVPLEEVRLALDRFVTDVLPLVDWAGAVVQPVVRADIPGLGPCEGHPDIILADGSVLDVKTGGGAAKNAFSVELGFYVLLCEADGGVVPRVGYLMWRRLVKPLWQLPLPIIDVTDELRRYAMARALAFARARDLDAHVNAGEDHPTNYTLTGGPKGAGQCLTCQYAPANGGPCEIATGATPLDNHLAIGA